MNENFAIESVFVTNKIKLKIDNVEDVKEFVSLACEVPEEMTMTRGSVTISAKSIMGVCSFVFDSDTNKWFYLRFDKFVTQEVLDKFKKWEVE